MDKNLTITNQNSKLTLSKTRSLLDITNKLLSKKDIPSPACALAKNSTKNCSLATIPCPPRTRASRAREEHPTWEACWAPLLRALHNAAQGQQIQAMRSLLRQLVPGYGPGNA